MSRLTPLDIEKQVFSRAFKGYSVDEVRGFLHIVSEETEYLVKELHTLSRLNTQLRQDLADHAEREQMLRQTLLSAQKISDDVKANARKEAELIVKDAELLADRVISQTMERVNELEKTIIDLKMQRKAARNRLQAAIEPVQQLIELDAEHESSELPITRLFRRKQSEG